MDINQSPLSRSKSDKAGVSRSAAEAKALAEAAKSRGTSAASSAQNIKQQDIREGQLVKGQVVDLRYNEVKIRLEPGEQVITARLSGDVSLSIGQKAQFLVTEEASDRLVLKYLPEDTLPTDSTIQKALAASSLPLTERNKALVAELLDRSMPIDKQTLQTLVKLSVMNREASPLTLVLMYKNNIPMTSSNIKQFEAYQAGTRELIRDIRTISQNISELLKEQPVALQNANSNQAQSAASDSVISSPWKEAVSINGKLIDILYSSSESTGSAPGSTQLNQFLSPEELTILGKAIEQKLAGSPALPGGLATVLQSNLQAEQQAKLSSDLFRQIGNGSLSVEEAVTLLTNLYLENENQPDSISLQDILTQFRTAAGNDAAAILEKLLDQYAQPRDTSSGLSEVLSPAQRAGLLQLLSGLTDSPDRKEQITQGTISLKETFALIQERLENTGKESAGKLLQSPEYAKLFEEAFLQKWTIKPEDTAEKTAVADLYRQLQEDLEKISTLANAEKTGTEIQSFQEPVKNLQENLQFLKDINNVFTYLQLPVRFQDQEAHTDLYVLTRKKALNDKRETLSVLLHLEMKNLGSLNVHIQQNHGKQLQADFYLENAETGRLIRQNLSLLTDALQKKGYNVRADVRDTYQKPDFARDFIEQSSQDHLIKRYTFDIRT